MAQDHSPSICFCSLTCSCYRFVALGHFSLINVLPCTSTGLDLRANYFSTRTSVLMFITSYFCVFIIKPIFVFSERKETDLQSCQPGWTQPRCKSCQLRRRKIGMLRWWIVDKSKLVFRQDQCSDFHSSSLLYRYKEQNSCISRATRTGQNCQQWTQWWCKLCQPRGREILLLEHHGSWRRFR